jgi:alpha-1,6-mannosyltransferase
VRLCDVTDAYHSTGGGIRTYLEEKRRYIRSSTDFEHVLIVPSDRDFEIRDGRLITCGIASPRIPGCGPYRFMVRHPRISRLIRDLRPDVVEIGNPYFQPRAARGFPGRFPAVVSGFYHTDFPKAYVEQPLRRVLGRRGARRAGAGAARFARYVHSNLDVTLVSSPALRRKLRGIGVPRVELLPLGVDSTTFHPDRRDPALRRSLNVDDDDVLLVFAGRLDAEKRIDVLLEMTARFPPAFRWKLIVLGQGPRRALVERAGARDPRIRCLPFEPDRSRLARLLASADLYVSAVRTETFGLSVIEAQASGLAVVGQRAGAMIDRVSESEGILVSDPGPDALAAGVMALAGDGFRVKGGNARKRVETEFAWDRTFSRLFGLYDSLRRGRERSRSGAGDG